MSKGTQRSTRRTGHRSPFRNKPDIVERQRRAVELRSAGVTYDEIAKALGYSNRKGAWKAVDAALKKTLREATEALREIERERLDQMLKAIWQRVLKGEPKAIEVALRISERRARLDGLDAPKKLDHTTDGQPLFKAYCFDPENAPEPEPEDGRSA
jgi:DNA-binding transcriptional MerR regulator